MLSDKKRRQDVIVQLLQSETISNQEELMKRLLESGFSVTQSTLSRDIRQLKIAKIHDEEGNYTYRLPDYPVYAPTRTEPLRPSTIEFSGNLAVIKTRPGYAMGIASDIDTFSPYEILGTIAGDDTILIIPREGISREKVIDALSRFI